jgi:hypothetical protein
VTTLPAAHFEKLTDGHWTLLIEHWKKFGMIGQLRFGFWLKRLNLPGRWTLSKATRGSTTVGGNFGIIERI